MDTWNRQIDLRGEEDGGNVREQPNSTYTYMQSPWTQK